MAETDSSRRLRARASTRLATIAAAAVSHGAAPAGARSQRAASAATTRPSHRIGTATSCPPATSIGPTGVPVCSDLSAADRCGPFPYRREWQRPRSSHHHHVVALRRRRATRRRRRRQRVVLPAVGTCFGQAGQMRHGRAFGDADGGHHRRPDLAVQSIPQQRRRAPVQTTEPNPLPRCPRVFAGAMKRLRPHEAGTDGPQRRPRGSGKRSHDAVLALRGAKIARAAVEPETGARHDHLCQPAQRRHGRGVRQPTEPPAGGKHVPAAEQHAHGRGLDERRPFVDDVALRQIVDEGPCFGAPRLPHRDAGQYRRRPTCEIVTSCSGFDARPGTALRPRPVAAGRRAAWRATPSPRQPPSRPPTPRPRQSRTPTRAPRPQHARAPTSRQPEPDEHRRGILHRPAARQRASQFPQHPFGRGMSSTRAQCAGPCHDAS